MVYSPLLSRKLQLWFAGYHVHQRNTFHFKRIGMSGFHNPGKLPMSGKSRNPSRAPHSGGSCRAKVQRGRTDKLSFMPIFQHHINVLRQACITLENNKAKHTYHEGSKQLLLVVDMGVTVPGARGTYCCQRTGPSKFEDQISCEQMLKSMK